MNDSFPFFIVGAPRSGTKLLRALLNNHPDISLGGEGNFIPALTGHFGHDVDTSQPKLWLEIHRVFSRSTYHRTKAQQGFTISEQAFVAALNARAAQHVVAWADIFEVMLRAYGPRPEAPVYGDKSHGYLNNIPLLRTLMPNVRFIFIVRDPRDQALSALKSWGRNPLRSAQHWYSVAAQAERLGFATAADVLTVRYEDLTADTGTELKRICTSLQLPYLAEMNILKRPAESWRREGQLKVVTKQHAKYRDALPTHLIRDISEITLPYLAAYGYDLENARHHRTLHKGQLKRLSYTDGLAMLRHHMQEKGPVRGFNYYLRRHIEASTSFRSHKPPQCSLRYLAETSSSARHSKTA